MYYMKITPHSQYRHTRPGPATAARAPSILRRRPTTERRGGLIEGGGGKRVQKSRPGALTKGIKWNDLPLPVGNRPTRNLNHIKGDYMSSSKPTHRSAGTTAFALR